MRKMEEKKGALLLGTENIGKLLKKYAMPAIIAMTASSLYNMVDSIFIGHGVGAMAISGLAITFPFMNLAAALGSLVGVGASTVTAIELGKKYFHRHYLFDNMSHLPETDTLFFWSK
jgi:Na+-driven multidrug efflux pump